VAALVIGIGGLLLKQPWMDNISLAAWFTVMMVYLGDGGLELFRQFSEWREVNLKIQYAGSQGRTFDLRPQREYVLARRGQGTTIYPAFPRGLLLRSGADTPTETVLRGDDGTSLLPLGSISNVLTVRGNETGEYLVYSSDEHGFHNPPDIWSLPRLKIAAVGDSFVQGESVRSESNMIAIIRARVPATLNLGHGGNGPLSELATILEYLPQRRPEIVLWVFCEENDIQEDLEREKRSDLMMGYLETPARIQRLDRRQPEIDEKLRRYFELQLNSSDTERSSGSRLRNWLALHELAFAVSAFRNLPPEDFVLFQRVLAAAKNAVSSWNGSLLLVYLPVQGNIKPGSFGLGPRSSARRTREHVLQICSALAIPVLDLEKRFAEEPSRRRDYFYPYHAHFTEKGYRRAGELVLDELQKQRLLGR